MLIIRNSKAGFTLVELLVIVIVLGVLITFAVPGYLNLKLRIRDNEAKTGLRLLQTAVKNKRIEEHGYGLPRITCTDTAGCNALYGLDLPLGEWNYWVRVYGLASPLGRFCANADKIDSRGRRVRPFESWHIWVSEEEATDCRCGGASCTGR